LAHVNSKISQRHSALRVQSDCCNEHGAPSYSIKKLQRVQNNAARIVLEVPRRSHVSPLLRTLHWLPVQQRIDYKVALLTFKVRSTSTKSYLRLLIQDREHGHNLRSTTTALRQPFTTTFAKRAFRCSAPAIYGLYNLWLLKHSIAILWAGKHLLSARTLVVGRSHGGGGMTSSGWSRRSGNFPDECTETSVWCTRRRVMQNHGAPCAERRIH